MPALEPSQDPYEELRASEPWRQLEPALRRFQDSVEPAFVRSEDGSNYWTFTALDRDEREFALRDIIDVRRALVEEYPAALVDEAMNAQAAAILENNYEPGRDVDRRTVYEPAGSPASPVAARLREEAAISRLREVFANTAYDRSDPGQFGVPAELDVQQGVDGLRQFNESIDGWMDPLAAHLRQRLHEQREQADQIDDFAKKRELDQLAQCVDMVLQDFKERGIEAAAPPFRNVASEVSPTMELRAELASDPLPEWIPPETVVEGVSINDEPASRLVHLIAAAPLQQYALAAEEAYVVEREAMDAALDDQVTEAKTAREQHRQQHPFLARVDDAILDKGLRGKVAQALAGRSKAVIAFQDHDYELALDVESAKHYRDIRTSDSQVQAAYDHLRRLEIMVRNQQQARVQAAEQAGLITPEAVDYARNLGNSVGVRLFKLEAAGALTMESVQHVFDEASQSFEQEQVRQEHAKGHPELDSWGHELGEPPPF